MSHVEEGTLHAMLDGELTAGEAASVEAHLDHCASCRALLDEVKEFVAEADTLIVALDEGTAPMPHRTAGKGGQADGRTGGPSGRPWYRRPQVLAVAATITLAIGAGYLGLALRDQASPVDQTGLMSEADAPSAGQRDSGAAEAVGAVGQPRANVGNEAAKDELSAGAGEARQRAEPVDVVMESEEVDPTAALPALADSPAAPLPSPPADRDRVAGRQLANEGNVAAAEPPADDGLDETLNRLDASIKLIDGRRPVRIEQEPAPALEGATSSGGLVRVVYQDEEDREFVLEQMKVSFDNDTSDNKRDQPAEAQKAVAAFAEREAFLRVTPNDTVISSETDSTVRIRWVDADGVLLALIGVDEAFLREMMERIK